MQIFVAFSHLNFKKDVSLLRQEGRGKKVDFISKVMLDNLTFGQGWICRLKLVLWVKNVILTYLFP